MNATLVGALVLEGVLAAGLAAYGTRARARVQELRRDLAQVHAALRDQRLVVADVAACAPTPGTRDEALSLLQLAHELRSPLASIQSALDMLLQGYAAGNPALHDEMLSLARDRTASMLSQVNDLLRLGSVRHVEFARRAQTVQMLDVLQRLLPEFRVRARWRSVEVRVQAPESLPPVKATGEDVQHLLTNLVNNAIKYTNPGGQVTISFHSESSRVSGSVRDTGIGIAPEDLPHVFDEFYRAPNARELDATGTGLGLSIAKRVTELYGGELRVESELGLGSCFTFTFPAVTP